MIIKDGFTQNIMVSHRDARIRLRRKEYVFACYVKCDGHCVK